MNSEQRKLLFILPVLLIAGYCDWIAFGKRCLGGGASGHRGSRNGGGCPSIRASTDGGPRRYFCTPGPRGARIDSCLAWSTKRSSVCSSSSGVAGFSACSLKICSCSCFLHFTTASSRSCDSLLPGSLCSASSSSSHNGRKHSRPTAEMKCLSQVF